MNARWPQHGSTPRGLYLITPDESDTARLLARTAPLLAAGSMTNSDSVFHAPHSPHWPCHLLCSPPHSAQT